MKFLLFVAFGLSIALFFGCCSTFYSQKNQNRKLIATYKIIQREQKDLEEDLEFLQQHQKEFAFLAQKGWFAPESRLRGGEAITEQGRSLNAMHFWFEPETSRAIDRMYFFNITKIIIKIEAALEEDIYHFIKNIFHTFPGVLLLQNFSVSRKDEINLLALGRSHGPNFVVSEIVYEWFSMGDKVDAEISQ